MKTTHQATETPRPPAALARLARLGCLFAAVSLVACGPTPDTPASDGSSDSGANRGADAASGADGVDAISDDAAGHDVSAGPRLVHVTLGDHKTLADGRTADIAFDLPVGVTAIVVRVEGDPALHYILASLERDAGFSLIPKAWLDQAPVPDACVTPCANRMAAQPGAAAFLFPNTPLVDLRPGPHRLRVYAFDAKRQPAQTTVQVSLDLVRPRAPPGGWRLPVNLCLTGAMGWNAGNALDQPRLVAALVTAQQLLAPAGIALDPIRTVNVSAKGQYIASQHGPDSDLMQLFLSGDGLPNGLNVFLTERVVAVGGLPGANVVLGLAGGIPGLPNSVGHARDGIALSLVVPPGQTDVLGHTMAHEIGHYLGLFHASEAKSASGSGVHDTLPDTLPDDPTNLMFWSVGTQATKLSHEQIQVMRRSPWLVAVP